MTIHASTAHVQSRGAGTSQSNAEDCRVRILAPFLPLCVPHPGPGLYLLLWKRLNISLQVTLKLERGQVCAEGLAEGRHTTGA